MGLPLSASEIATAEALGAAAGSQTDPWIQDRYVPFEPYLHWDETVWAKEWEELAKSYNGDPARKIDRDWLNTAAEFTLQLDSYTNNTSLVLAFELTES